MGSHSIKRWSKTQALIALSSGESELYAALNAAAEILGIMSVFKDLNWQMEGRAYGDASAILGVINRDCDRPIQIARIENCDYVRNKRRGADGERQCRTTQ